MKKKGTLVYSLTTRGLFSELSNWDLIDNKSGK